ncbi:hypothetical protein DL771_003505 [Monosporascus sp. 5C6A]|nr:hypothetical protein DL771_003505 [Monosporascus sp. 5C6A]
MPKAEETMNHGDRARELEYKYIELLEKRIASLEAARTNHNYQNNHDEDVESGTRPCLVTRLRQRVLIDGGVAEEEDIDPSDFESLVQQPPSEKDIELPETSYKLTWYRVLSEKKKYKYSEFNVDSRELQALLQVALSHYPRLHFASDGMQDKITFKSPFESLIHNWDKLLALTNSESAEYERLSTLVTGFDPMTDDGANPLASALICLTKEGNMVKARLHLCEMLSRIRSTPELKQYFSGLDGQAKGKSVQFDYLWTIFPPGEVVYSVVFMKEPQLFIVKQGYEDVASSESGRETKRVWKLICWSYDWNGRTFSRVPIKFRFEEFQGSRAIETLEVYPLRYHNSASKVPIDQLTAMLRRRGERFRDLCTREKGQQMFDYEGEAITHGAGFQKLGNRRNDDRASGLLLLSDAYGLRRRAPPQSSAKSQKIDGRVMVDFAAYLQHAPQYSSLAPMGDAHLSRKDDECRCSTCLANNDLRENQKTYWDNVAAGEEFEDLQLELCPPRVLGPPGVGKTLTAVLLRVLEYYNGILILTTNRIREFDIAVQSRVNLGIKYEDLDRDQKQNIIENFLSQLKDENVDRRQEIVDWFNKDEEGREQIKPLNGRQVRNILFSAASLAMKDGTAESGS